MVMELWLLETLGWLGQGLSAEEAGRLHGRLVIRMSISAGDPQLGYRSPVGFQCPLGKISTDRPFFI